MNYLFKHFCKGTCTLLLCKYISAAACNYGQTEQNRAVGSKQILKVNYSDKLTVVKYRNSGISSGGAHAVHMADK